MLDLDNTLTRWNDPDPPPELAPWLTLLKQKGFVACIISNNSDRRVGAFAARIDIPYIPNATKPRRSGFRRAMSLLGVTPAQTAVVGDQLFTDVLGGNRSGAYTILVVPVDRYEFVGTRAMRVIERLILRYLTGRSR